jgi:hypothetical protein
MLIQLIDIKSRHPSFEAPTTKNGEPMELHSVEASGQYVVARYFYSEPQPGPSVDYFFCDLFCNSEGCEVYRVTAKIIPPPAPRPTFGVRFAGAVHALFS